MLYFILKYELKGLDFFWPKLGLVVIVVLFLDSNCIFFSRSSPSSSNIVLESAVIPAVSNYSKGINTIQHAGD